MGVAQLHRRYGRLATAVVVGFLTVISGCGGKTSSDAANVTAPFVEAGPMAMRRLTERQYRATIADIFGDDVVVAGRIEPDNRHLGLFAVGSSFVSVTASGFEQYEAIARGVAAQALASERRTTLVSCAPADPTAPDDHCAEAFVRAIGRRLFRRPLRDEEVQSRVSIAAESAGLLHDFFLGLESALATLLVSPEFLFRVESAEPDANDPGKLRLTSLSMASRLSYFLWDTTPDEELLAAAERGELVDAAGLEAQVQRMLASPLFERNVRAFFGDLFSFSDIEQGLVRKDPVLFPAFNQAMIADGAEQTLRMVVDQLLTNDGDYRELFTTRKTFMSRALGIVYRVPVRTRDGFEEYEFANDDPRAGLLSQVSLLALYSHPGRSSPTLRGKFVREVLLCQDVPPPPGDVDFSKFADADTLTLPTARDRLGVHVSNAACSGCHALMDPIGLGLERFDGLGALRDTENGASIDASGALNGTPFADAKDLGRVLSRDPLLGPCFVTNYFEYALGREVAPGETDFVHYMVERLQRSGYRVRELARMIALGDAFRTTSGARAADVPPTPNPQQTPDMATTPTGSPDAATETPNGEVTPMSTPTGATATPVDTRAADSTRTPTATPLPIVFTDLQNLIFMPRCTSVACHSTATRAGGLVLEGSAGFDNLVGVEPVNAAARADGLLRVAPGLPNDSFLLVKLRGPSDTAYGSRMPLIGAVLTPEEIGMVERWISSGAER